MKRLLLICTSALVVLSYLNGRAQTPAEFKHYEGLIRKAQQLYRQKKYQKSALTYTAAFQTLGWKGYEMDRYDAACTWAQAGNADSAFLNLERITTKLHFADYNHIRQDKDLLILHRDARWELLLTLIKQNKEQQEAHYIKPVVRQLDSIYNIDQAGRLKLEELMKTKGTDSPEFQRVRKQLVATDSINLLQVKAILDQYGWLGKDQVGQQGNTTLFLVIQHADLKTQQHYLPLLRSAVQVEKAQPDQLAMLEDRVALGEGRHQLYGSQIGQDSKGLAVVLPLLDPDQVDQRRAAVGLEPLADYVKQWNIKWNLSAYKKQLPALEKAHNIKNH